MNAGETSARTTSKVDRLLGERIRLRRLEVRMSQEQLAERLGITFQQIQKYEKGVNRVAASRLLDIADVLDIPVAVFYERLSKRKSTANQSEILRLDDTHLLSQLAGILVNLSGHGRQLLLETARTFARQEQRLKQPK